jgi:branched-chain amino acid transport system ATP-binding protein
MLALGRALIFKPDMLSLDEPSMGLAPMVARKTIEEVKKAIHVGGTTVFLSKQNARMTIMITRRGYVWECGRIVPEDFSSEPINNDQVEKGCLGT